MASRIARMMMMMAWMMIPTLPLILSYNKNASLDLIQRHFVDSLAWHTSYQSIQVAPLSVCDICAALARTNIQRMVVSADTLTLT